MLSSPFLYFSSAIFALIFSSFFLLLHHYRHFLFLDPFFRLAGLLNDNLYSTFCDKLRMKRTSTHLWIQLVLILVLTTINVPPWLMFKGNTIASVCALDVSVGSEGYEPNVVVVETQDQDGEHDERTREILAYVQGSQQQRQQQQRPLGCVDSDPSLEERIVAADPHLDSQSRGEGDTEKVAPDAPQTPLEVPSPQNPYTSSSDDFVAPTPEQPTTGSTHPIRRLINTYYARLSAVPGTEEAIAQHAVVRKALLALPGKATIRHEFGMDEDDVLNVISFKLEGNSDGLEEVAALVGVIGIYPVVSEKPLSVIFDLLVWFFVVGVAFFDNS